MILDVKTALMNYGLEILAQQTGGEAQQFIQGDEWKQVDWSAYEGQLGKPGRSQKALLTIFSLINPSPEEVKPAYYRPQKLALDEKKIFPQPEESDEGRRDLWNGFVGEWKEVQAEDEALRFEIFYHLYRKYAWAIPCTYGEAGVSLFEQFKAVSALAHASPKWETGPAEKYSLVGGDIPGIQDFVYTITSKGAAKGLRGRSFFIQLLGDAVVRRLLVDLELCPANVVYSAGGNFMVLGPGGNVEVNGRTTEERLAGLQKEMDGALLDIFKGDLSLCLAWTLLRADQVGSHDFADPVSKGLKGLIAEEKRRRFSAVAKDRWDALFGSQGRPGNRYCVICQRPLGRDKDEWVPMEGEDDLLLEERSRRCLPCDGFKKLAERIGQEGLLAIGGKRPQKGEPWQEALWQVGRVWYDYGPPKKLKPRLGGYLYTINDTDFRGKHAHGFRFIANVTPRVTQEDVERWGKEPEEGEERPILGSIRTFSQMADVARGVRWVGVLRMDLDDLGQIMVRGLKSRTLAATSALSTALDLFFAGWLNNVCAEVNQLHRRAENGEDRGDRLYAIYAGGDDLFVVGSWDLTPELAKRIQEQFKDYTGHNPALHISAGITLEGRKFPLYQAAERAGRAEDAAKEHTRHGIPKDAISFLGLAVKWDEWPEVTRRLDNIIRAIGSGKASRALIQVLQSIYAQYEQQMELEHKRCRGDEEPLPDEPPYQVYYGPWMWREAYALTRMASRIEDKNTKSLVLNMQVGTLSPLYIRHVGLAARWAELLTRKEKEQ